MHFLCLKVSFLLDWWNPGGKNNLENKSEAGIDKEIRESPTAPWQRLRMKVGIMSFDQQTADIYLTAEMVICERGQSKAAPVYPAKLVYTRFAEYVDEISHRGRLWAVFVPRLHSLADGRRCRRQTLDIQQETWTLPWCTDASEQAAGVHPPEWMNEFISESLHIHETTFASHVTKRFTITFREI